MTEVTDRQPPDIYRLQEQFFRRYPDKLCPKVVHIDQWLNNNDHRLVHDALKYARQEEVTNPIGFVNYLLQNPHKINLLPDKPKPQVISPSMLQLQQRLDLVGSIEVRDQDDVHQLTMGIPDLEWALTIGNHNFNQQRAEDMIRLFWIYYQKDKACTARAVSRVYCIVRFYPVLFQQFRLAALADWISRSQAGQLPAESLTEEQLNQLTSASEIGGDFFLAPLAQVAEQIGST